MGTMKRMFQPSLTAREMVRAKRVMASIMLPILVFYMTSMNILAMEMMKASAADGSGHMTINKDTVAAGATQTYKLTFDPTEAMDGGEVKISVPSGWTEPTSSNTSISSVGSPSLGDLSFPDNDIVVPINTMASNEGFVLTLTDIQAPTTIGDYTFTTKAALAGGSLRTISSSPVVTVTPGAVDHYIVSNISSPKTVGVDFDVTVTAKDINNNTTAGSGSVDISVKTGSGTLVGDTAVDTTGDGVDSATLKYNKVESGVVFEASADGKSGDSNLFNVQNLIAPTFSSPGSSTNDSTPFINWSDVSGTGVEYTMKLRARTGVDCATEDYTSGLLLDKTPASSQYQVANDEALVDETTYCVRMTATDDYLNSIETYKTFSLLTSKPATPVKDYIEIDNGANGHPENTINAYNNEGVSVKVYHTATLDGGKVYVKIKDGLGNETSEYNADIVGAATNTVVSGIDASSLQQGTNLEIYARVADAGTNSSDWATTTTSGGGSTDVTKDISAPARPSAVSFVDNPVNAGNDNAVNVQVVGEGSVEAYYNITSSGGGSAVTGHFTMDADGDTTSPDIDVTSLGDGTLTASVYLMDNVWNHGSSQTGTVTKDATAPDVSLTYNLNRAVKDTDTLRITATFSEDVKDSPKPQITVDFNGAGSDISATDMTKTDATHYYFDVDIPAGNDGTATVAISNAQDLSGNGNNAAANNTFVVDNTNPSVTFTDDVAAGPVIFDTVKITVTDANGDTSSYKYIFTDDNVCDSKDYGGGMDYTSSSDITFSDESHNNKYICAKAQDQAGNINYQSSANKLNIDITGPTLSFTDNVAVGPVRSDNVAVNWGDATMMKWDYSTSTTCSTVSGNYSKTNADSMNQTDATNNGKYICLYAEDALGNKTTLALDNPINIDITPPVITINNPSTDSAQDKTITASATESAALSFAVNDSGNDTCDETLATFSDYSSLTFNVETDNGKKVCYRAVDVAGNTAYSLSNAIAGIDTHAPVIEKFISTTLNGTYGPGSTIDITADYDENVAPGSTLTVVVDAGLVPVTLSTISGDKISGSYVVGTTGSGQNTFDLKINSIASQNVVDLAGNIQTGTSMPVGANNISDSSDIIIDTIAPSATLSGTPANPTNVTSVNVTVEGAGVATYKYKLDDGDYGAAIPVATAITASGLTEGSHSLYVTGIDGAGNEQESGTVYSWVVDTTPPTSALSYSANPAKAGDVVVSVVYSEDIKAIETPTISIEQSGTTDITDVMMIMGIDRQHWTYTYTVNVANGAEYVDGTANVTLSVNHDEAGNVVGAPTGNSFVIDTTAPVVDITQPTGAVKINADKIVAFTDGELTSPECSINAGAWVSCVSNSTKISDLPGWGDVAQGATFTLNLRDTDLAGNIGSDNEASLIKDTALPIITGITLSDATPANTGNETFTINLSEDMDTSVNPTVSFGISDPYNQHIAGLTPTWNSATQFKVTINILTGWDGTNTIKISGAKDTAGNVMADDMSHNFVIDTVKPTSAIVSPATGSYVGGVFTITGTSEDNAGGSGISSVRVRIKRSSDNNYWNGTGWQAASSWRTPVGTTSWTYNFTGSIDDTTYIIDTYATDRASNTTATPYSSITVYGDVNLPTSTINALGGAILNDLGEVSGTAADTSGTNHSGVQGVNVQIHDTTADLYWNSTGWDGSSSWIAAVYASDNWNFDTSAVSWESGHSYIISSRATDNVNNQEMGGPSVTFIFDNAAPNAPTYNSSEADTVWYNVNPTLDIDFSDNYKIDKIEYKVDSAGTYRIIESDINDPNYTNNWSITSGPGGDWDNMTQGVHYLYFRITDYSGNVYETSDDNAGFRFKKDITAPNAPTYHDEGQWYKEAPTWNIDFADNMSLKSVKYQLDGTADGGWIVLADNINSTSYAADWDFDSSTDWSALSDGDHYIYFQLADYAGTIYTTPDEASAFNFKKDTTTPSDISNLTATPSKEIWTTDNVLHFNWDDSTDVAGSGVAGYSYVLDHTSGTVPDGTIETTSSEFVTDSLADGNDWYFHVRTIDEVGNVSAVSEIGPFYIDTTDPTIDHHAVSEGIAGEDIHISADVDDNGSGVKEVHVYYKHHGDSSFTDHAMDCDGSWHCTYDIPDEENASHDVKYYIKAWDNVDNDSSDGTSSDPHTVDIKAASLNHFTFIHPSGDKTAGSYFAVAIEARDEFNNTADQYDGGNNKVSFTTDQDGVSVFVKGEAENISPAFDNGTWIGEIKLGTGGITPSDNDIRVTATDIASSTSGDFTIDTAGANFGATGTVQGVQSGGGGEDQGVLGEEVTGSEGNQGILGEEGQNIITPSPWKSAMPYEAAGLLVLIGGGIWWWIRRGGKGAGQGGGASIFFLALKDAALKARMFLW